MEQQRLLHWTIDAENAFKNLTTLLIFNQFDAETSGWLPVKRYFTRVNIRQDPVMEIYSSFESCFRIGAVPT